MTPLLGAVSTRLRAGAGEIVIKGEELNIEEFVVDDIKMEYN
jgi:hypothetical protein